MRGKIPIFVPVVLCALLLPTKYVISADDPAALLKQADSYSANKQYDQAEQLYLALAKGNSPEAFTAQKNLAFLYITQTPPQLDKAEAAYQQLLSRFAKNEGLCQAIYEIGRRYDKISQTDKALQLHQSNAERYPNDLYGMYSQVEIVKSCIAAGPQSEGDAAVEKLLTVFAKQPTLPKEVYQLAREYQDTRDRGRTLALDQYNADHFATNVYGMWSQVNLDLRKGNQSAADAGVDKILAQYPDDPATQQGVYELTAVYNKVRRPDKAARLYRYHIDHWPQAKEALDVRKGLAIAYIDLGDDPNAQAMVNTILADYAKHPKIAKSIYDLGLHYSRLKKSAESIKLHQYNVEHSPKDDLRTMWSQTEVAKAYIRDGNDLAADAAVNTLLTTFAKQETLATETTNVADTYREAGKYSRADGLYASVMTQHPNDEAALFARVGLGAMEIRKGNDRTGEAIFQAILTENPTHARLPEAVELMAEAYFGKALMESGGDPNGNGRPSDLGVTHIRKAIEKWDLIINSLPTDPEVTPLAYYCSAVAYYQLGEYSEFIKRSEELTDKWPDYGEAWRAQILRIKTYKQRLTQGAITEAEALAAINEASQQLVDKYPFSPAASSIREALERQQTTPTRPQSQLRR